MGTIHWKRPGHTRRSDAGPGSPARLFRRALPILLASLLAVHAAEAPAGSILEVQANFYDFPIEGIDGEFGSRKPGACGYSDQIHANGQPPFSVIGDMVKDTLLFSKDEGKKFPRRGSGDCNSENLERWFLPAQATSATCRDLAFVRVDTLGSSYWLKEDRRFFPIDGIAPPGQLEGGPLGWDDRLRSLTGQDTAAHNFNWCMEINAQFRHAPGKVFHVDGEDDLWLYIDNMLVVDLGGIHGPGNPRKVVLDSLPFLAGRHGELIDFDFYQCERRPGGSEIMALVDLELLPPRFVDLEMAFPDGTYPHPDRPVAGPTRFCAQPVYASKAPCANSLPVPAEPFVPALWSIGGEILARDSACIDFDPAVVPPNSPVELVARAEGKTARLPLQVVRADFPAKIVLSGHGRVDSVSLRLDSRSDSLVGPVRIDFTLGGEEHSYHGGPADFRPDRRSLVWRLPGGGRGPTGVSGEDSLAGRMEQTIQGWAFSEAAPIVDSATPAVWRAAWHPAGRDGYSLEIVPTEPLASPPLNLLDAFLFKDSHGRPIAPSAVGVTRQALSDGSLRVSFPREAGLDTRRIDSVSFSGSIRDRAGNRARALFTAIVPLAWGSGFAGIVSADLERNPVHGEAFIAAPAARSLVLLDRSGGPIGGGGERARLAASGGPVLAVRTLEPLDRIHLRFYSNLGAFLHGETYEFTEEEWSLLKADAGGDTVTARILWYPVAGGVKLGTGAYVVKGTVATRRNWRRDASGIWREMLPTRSILGPLRFGYIRR
jgi:fibro-slime domain-containing protein